MPVLTPDEGIRLLPGLLKLILKLIKYSKKGLDKAERAELAEDLLHLALKVGEEALD